MKDVRIHKVVGNKVISLYFQCDGVFYGVPSYSVYARVGKKRRDNNDWYLSLDNIKYDATDRAKCTGDGSIKYLLLMQEEIMNFCKNKKVMLDITGSDDRRDKVYAYMVRRFKREHFCTSIIYNEEIYSLLIDCE